MTAQTRLQTRESQRKSRKAAQEAQALDASL
jgi:hypothetical protein